MKVDGYIEIEVGKSISILDVFQYFIDDEVIKSITKGLYFDLRDENENKKIKIFYLFTQQIFYINKM